MDREQINKTIGQLHREIDAVFAEVQMLNCLPKTSDELRDLLCEFADAYDDRNDHFKRFPRPEGVSVSPYESTIADKKTVEADWSRCLSRFDKATHLLAQFAIRERDRSADEAA